MMDVQTQFSLSSLVSLQAVTWKSHRGTNCFMRQFGAIARADNATFHRTQSHQRSLGREISHRTRRHQSSGDAAVIETTHFHSPHLWLWSKYLLSRCYA